jgi:hypothetical protein
VSAAGEDSQSTEKKKCEVIMKPRIAIALVVSIATLGGCQQHANSPSGAPAVSSADASPNDAIRTAIQAHLAHNGNLNLKSFDTYVKEVTIDRNQAQAQVEFHVKNGPGVMQLTYQLAKRDGAWAIVESQPVSSNFSHPALDKAQTPAAGGAMGGDSAIFRALDNFHGGVATSPQNLPPGHPAIAPSPKDTKPEMP